MTKTCVIQTYSYCTLTEMRKHICILNISEFAFQLKLKTPSTSVTIPINTPAMRTRQTRNKVKHKNSREKLHLGKVDPSAAAMTEHHSSTTDANTNAMSWLVKAKRFYKLRLREQTKNFLFGLWQLHWD